MGKRRRQRQCRHLNALGIYGDAILVMRGRRGVCPDCRLVLDKLPAEVAPTGREPIPALPGFRPDPLYLAMTGRDYPPTGEERDR